MTINSQIRTAGPFTGDNVATTFPFAFKVFLPTDVIMVETNLSGVDRNLVYNTDYSVTLNVDQNAAPGGSIFYKVAGVTTPLPTGYVLNGTSALSNLQPVNITNGGGFFPKVINDALDRLTILVQQIARIATSALQYPLSDGGLVSAVLPGKALRATKVFAFDAGGAPTVSNLTLAQLEAQPAGAAASAAAAAASALAAANSANLTAAYAGWRYVYSNTTTAADPGSGILRYNNTTLASATALYISETSNLAQTIAAIIADWGASTSAVKSQLRMFKQSDPTVYAVFNITSTATDNGTWDTFTVAYVGGAGAFANNDVVSLQVIRVGDKGDIGTAGAAGVNSGQDLTINADMDLWRRGLSQSAGASNIATADHWYSVGGGSPGAATVSRQAFAPAAGPDGAKNFLRHVQSVAAVTTAPYVRQFIPNVLQLTADTPSTGTQAVTVDFWARSPQGASVGINPSITQYFGTGGSPSSLVITSASTQFLTTSWARYSITINVPSTTGKTLGTAGDDGLVLSLGLPLGSTYTIEITRARLYRGTAQQNFVKPTSVQNYLNCCAFYVKSFLDDTTPAQNVAAGQTVFQQTVAASTAMITNTIQYPVRMYATPNTVLYNPAAANAQARNLTTASDFSGTTVSQQQLYGFAVTGTTAGAGAVGNACAIQYSSDCQPLI